MDNETLLEIRDKSYLCAKNKGFFVDNCSDLEYITAIHEELSEAFRAYNKSLGWIIKSAEGKPDGVYYELTDAVIRLFSYCGYKGYTLKQYNIETDRPYDKDDLCDVILKSHLSLSQYYEMLQKDFDDDYQEYLANNCISNLFSRFIARIEVFIFDSSEEEFALHELIENKLSYNATREKKHGNNKV